MISDILQVCTFLNSSKISKAGKDDAPLVQTAKTPSLLNNTFNIFNIKSQRKRKDIWLFSDEPSRQMSKLSRLQEHRFSDNSVFDS